MSMKSRASWLASTTVGCLFSASPGVAATHRVPADYPTIQAGLDAAAFGDTVLVAPGTYTDYESRTFGSQTLTACAFLVDGVVLRSEQGPSVTTIDMQGQGSGVAAVVIGLYLASGQTVLEGFTVTGAPPVGTGSGAALVGGATTTVRDCIFRDLASGADTGGIFANNASLVVVGCEFENCVGGIAGGIWQDNAEITVTGSSFRNCSNHAIRLNGETAGYPETAVISDCEFIENSSTYDGGAVYVDSYSGGVQITGCRFERNLATGGSGGAVLVGNGTAEQYTIENCTFLFNRLESDLLGGAVFLYANTTVRGNTFYGNSQMSPLAGGQTIAIHTPSSIENNIIAGTSGTAAVWAYPGTDVAMHCNVFWENLGGNVEWLEMGPTDREVNPLFCDVPSEDFRLMKGSPCLPPGSKGCGLIGALGQGCDVISVMPRSWGAIKSAYR